MGVRVQAIWLMVAAVALSWAAEAGAGERTEGRRGDAAVRLDGRTATVRLHAAAVRRNLRRGERGASLQCGDNAGGVNVSRPVFTTVQLERFRLAEGRVRYRVRFVGDPGAVNRCRVRLDGRRQLIYLAMHEPVGSPPPVCEPARGEQTIVRSADLLVVSRTLAFSSFYRACALPRGRKAGAFLTTSTSSGGGEIAGLFATSGSRAAWTLRSFGRDGDTTPPSVSVGVLDVRGVAPVTYTRAEMDQTDPGALVELVVAGDGATAWITENKTRSEVVALAPGRRRVVLDHGPPGSFATVAIDSNRSVVSWRRDEGVREAAVPNNADPS